MIATIMPYAAHAGTGRERIEAAVVAGGKHARGPHDWIAVDPRGMVRVLVTGEVGSLLAR
jgi:hypothetical protein